MAAPARLEGGVVPLDAGAAGAGHRRQAQRGLFQGASHKALRRVSEAADAIIVGGGLAGLVAAAELGDAGKRVVILEQEGENSLGGQAFWSLGGLFFVDSP